jgi:uncharacterized protein (TIGR02246 family)
MRPDPVRGRVLLALAFCSACTSTPAIPPAPAPPASTLSAAEQAATTVVERQLAAYNARDAAAFAATYAPDVRIYTFPDQLWLSGRDQVRQRYAQLFAAAPALHATIERRIVHGALVVDHENVIGLPDGATARAVAIYEVKDGAISRVWLAR